MTTGDKHRKLDRHGHFDRRRHFAFVGLGLVLKALGLGVMFWALIALVPGGIGGLLVAIGGFLLVSAGAEIRIEALKRLRGSREQTGS